MEEKIRRGKVLREVLKQERMVLVSPEWQLAWMTAYNAGYFRGLDDAGIVGELIRLQQTLLQAPMSLSASVEAWHGWLRDHHACIVESQQ